MPKTMEETENRVETGIPGLDDLIEGGLIRNSSVLLRGKAGTGKTIFALHFLVHGALNGEPGVFLSVEERRSDLYREGQKFGWDLEALENDDKLAIIEPRPSYTMTIHELEETAQMLRAKRAVIDSIPALFLHFHNEFSSAEMRSAFYLLCQVLTDTCKCTAILITEADWSQRFPYEEYVPKGVIELSSKLMEGIARKFILIRKMREMRHSKRQHLYEITERGFTLFNPRM